MSRRLMRLMPFVAAATVALFCSDTVDSAPSKHLWRDIRKEPFLYDTFPNGFHWGTATSAYQTEGAWNEDGKVESIWDRFSHEGHISDNATGDVAADSYHQYKADIKLLKNLGVNFYRFSLSWPRIIPTGKLSDGINEAGIAHYNDLINALLAAGIEPMVTIYHWELPQPLQDDGGGWFNRDIVQHFNDFANVCFKHFGDRVKLWLTINEPLIMAWFGHGLGLLAPGVLSPDTGVYTVVHHAILAHAAAWHTYDQHYRPTQKGKVSMPSVCSWMKPSSDDEKDVQAAKRAMQFQTGIVFHPIFVNGDYPDVVKDLVAAKSKAEGRSQSRLPEFTDEEKKNVHGTCDFFAMNHYTSHLVKYVKYTESSWLTDMDAEMLFDPSWPATAFEHKRVVPWGIRKVLSWIRDNYGNLPIYVTEIGVSDDKATLVDEQRIAFHRGYINNVLKAIKLDGCNVAAYTAWSLTDTLEWAFGYSCRFGLHHVDFTDPARPRTPKKSAAFYRQLIADNGWPHDESTATANVSIEDGSHQPCN